VLNGHSNINEVQTAAQIFFPNERFSFIGSVPDFGWTVVSEKKIDGYRSEIFYDGVSKSVFFYAPDHSEITEKRVVILAVFYALKKIFNADTPWGALTGIRPTKLIRQWLAKNEADEDIISKLVNVYRCRFDKADAALQTARKENEISVKNGLIGKSSAAVYIGVPYCPSRCEYCSFTVRGTVYSDKKIISYIDALQIEINKMSKQLSGINISSVYIGGGTPTVPSDDEFERLLSLAQKNFCASKTEFTVEAGRPDSISENKLMIMKKYGVNRISVNPQTLNDRTLERIGRAHSANDFYRAFESARNCGFDNINSDVIAGLPGETDEDIVKTMDGLIKMQPDSITVHTLAIKRASRFNESCVYNDNAGIGSMLQSAHAACRQAGMVPYYLYRQKNCAGNLENIGFAKPGFECLYNVGMMSDIQTVYGFGAGAVTKLVDGDFIERKYNVKNPDIYIKKMIGEDD